jgi:hypothetical protein
MKEISIQESLELLKNIYIYKTYARYVKIKSINGSFTLKTGGCSPLCDCTLTDS